MKFKFCWAFIILTLMWYCVYILELSNGNH